MKKTIYSIAIAAVTLVSSTSCNDWLDLLPNNEQVTDNYWKSKEDVEAVVTSGYYYMRNAVPTLIQWGEVRGGTIYTINGGDIDKVQNFDVLPANSLCNYAGLYQIINMANSVLKYAPSVQTTDDTYYTPVLNSHLCEAYFQRAYAYSILVKNFKEVPLITEAYVTDKADFEIPKSSETDIINQIKLDILAALETGAAKASYEEAWQTKGRATKWALYALMADICLWNHDYDQCIEYCNNIIEATDALRPVFMTATEHWYDIFNPGNSNESIFELNWDATTYGESNNFASRFGQTTGSYYQIALPTVEKMRAETQAVLLNNPEMTTENRVGRMLMSSYICTVGSSDPGTGYLTAPAMYVWKYSGDLISPFTTRTSNDANFIIYRMAEILLTKAEALVMKGSGSWPAAVKLINQVRNRAGLPDYIDEELENFEAQIADLDELTLLTEVLDQREIELLAEGKRWYDVLRLARYDAQFAPFDALDADKANNSMLKTNNYKQVAIATILDGNSTTSDDQIESILLNSWAWYLPLPQSDIETNDQLVQNPYYDAAK